MSRLSQKCSFEARHMGPSRGRRIAIDLNEHFESYRWGVTHSSLSIGNLWSDER